QDQQLSTPHSSSTSERYWYSLANRGSANRTPSSAPHPGFQASCIRGACRHPVAESSQPFCPVFEQCRQKPATASSLRSSDSPSLLLLRLVINDIHETAGPAQEHKRPAGCHFADFK